MAMKCGVMGTLKKLGFSIVIFSDVCFSIEKVP